MTSFIDVFDLIIRFKSLTIRVTYNFAMLVGWEVKNETDNNAPKESSISDITALGKGAQRFYYNNTEDFFLNKTSFRQVSCQQL